MKKETLCFLIDWDSRKILLGMKKEGFGHGKYNGFGGKIEQGETIEKAAIRELYEETKIRASESDIKRVGKFDFSFFEKEEWNRVVYVYFINKWVGDPKESEEMFPKWFNFKEIPFDIMWKSDSYWLPLVLKGKKLEGNFLFDKDKESIKEHNIKEL